MQTDISPTKISRDPELPNLPKAVNIRFSDDKITFIRSNKGELSFELEQFPNLNRATSKQRAEWKLRWGGEAVRWEEIDEDISVKYLLTGED